MVLEKEIEKFLLVSPLNLVIVLHGVRLIRRILGWTPLGERRWRDNAERKCEHQVSHEGLRRSAETCSHPMASGCAADRARVRNQPTARHRQRLPSGTVVALAVPAK